MFLISVQDGVNDATSYDPTQTEWADQAAEIANNAPDVYTHTLWLEFIDLCAYREDPSDLGVDASDMEKAARVCLYLIAERLANVLFDEYNEDGPDDDDEDEDTDEMDEDDEVPA
jgi:hypothetical protein